MKNLNVMQAIIIGVSIVAIVVAVVIFSTSTGRSGGSSLGKTVIWGTVPESIFEEVLQKIDNAGDEMSDVTYVEKDPVTFENDLLRSMAEGTAPDIAVLNEKQILTNKNRLQVVPFKSFPLRDYQDLFIEEASLLVTKDGLLGFPFLVDPIVLYYNKDILNDAGYSKPPQTWTEVLAITPTLTQKDTSFNISKSAIALGSFDNISGVKDIFWTLVLQAGNPVIKREVISEEDPEIYTSIFTESLNFTLNPAYAATNFFVQFSNPTKTVYSWNRSLPNSQTAFVSGDLAFYLGKASELDTIKKLNPNLNFDITLVPQSQSSNKKVTYGSMYTLVIPKSAKNIGGATATIGIFTKTSAQNIFAEAMGIASVRKDVLATSNASNPYQVIFNKSAIIAQGILEPDATKMDGIIKELIDTVVSGEYEVSEAIDRADNKIILLLQNESQD
ncbi:MAG: hypothetical protein RLY49_107 [Candidatus Parcubacteria bacterium]|jgi:multiple sugar transport system substrate-binding protein